MDYYQAIFTILRNNDNLKYIKSHKWLSETYLNTNNGFLIHNQQ